MSKILNLKRWLTLGEAATLLSTTLKEEVTVADVLYLCMDARLILSLDIMNGCYARSGRIVDRAEAPTYISPFTGEEHVSGLSLNDGSVMILKDDIASLRGIFDIPFIGGERNDIERLYQEMIGGPDVELISIDGAFVRGKEGEYFQIQESYDDNEFTAGSSASGNRIKAEIEGGDIPADEASRRLAEHEKQRKIFLEHGKNKPRSERFYPAGGLPAGSALVIRADSLRDFMASLNDEPNETKPLSTTERNTMLKIIIGMAIGGYKYNPGASKGTAVKDIVTDLATHGIAVTDDTVRKYLKEAVEQVLPMK